VTRLDCMMPTCVYLSLLTSSAPALHYTVTHRSLNPLKTSGNLFYIRTQCVPRCKLSTSFIKTSILMMHKVNVAVCSEIH
jgi:hypothetical protein